MTDAEALVRRYLREAWEVADPSAVDTLLADGYVDHDAPPGIGPTRADQRRAVERLREATRERSVRIVKLHACGGAVTVRHDSRWVQVAPLFGIPGDGRRVLVRGCDLYVVAGGRIAESWHAESVTTEPTSTSG